MKNAIKIEAVLTILTVLLLSSVSIPQAKAPIPTPTQTWVKSPNNPVLSEATGWESTVWGPSVLMTPDKTYHMWYTGTNAIGYASSTTPAISWARGTHNPVLSPGPAAWDDQMVLHPSVVRVGPTLWVMWYTGYDGANYRIGGAYSSKPDDDWVKWLDPVLDKGDAGEWDDLEVWSCSVIWDGGVWKMWYSGSDGTKIQIGYAVSPDGGHWAKYAGNPVFKPSATIGDWDDLWVMHPSVWKEGDVYWMWYTGARGIGSWRIGCAYSYNGVTWFRCSGNPVLDVGPAAWDGQWVIAATVIPWHKIPGAFIMLYSGNDYSKYRIGCAASAAMLAHIPAFTESGIDETYFINADPLKPSMLLPVSTYDSVASGIIYGQCKYSQWQGFDTNPTWIDQTPGANLGKPLLTDTRIVLFGSGWTAERPYGPNNVVGYYSRALAPIKDIYPSDPTGIADSYALQKQDGTTVASRASSWFDGHHDLIAIMAFPDANGNFVLIIYGYTYVGTWAGGVWFCQHMLYHLQDYWGYTYLVVEWSEPPAGDGIPQVGEMTEIAAGE